MIDAMFGYAVQFLGLVLVYKFSAFSSDGYGRPNQDRSHTDRIGRLQFLGILLVFPLAVALAVSPLNADDGMECAPDGWDGDCQQVREPHQRTPKEITEAWENAGMVFSLMSLASFSGAYRYRLFGRRKGS